MKNVLIEKLDKAWSKKIREKGKCEVCGKSDGVLNAHHIVGRKNKRLRWDLRNGVCLCYTHHKGGTISAHEDPLWFKEWLEDKRWEDYSYLLVAKNEIKKWVDADGEDKLKELTRE